MTRKNLYKPEYCEKVIELMKDGMSIYEVALRLNVSHTTLYDWKKAHPEFNESMKEAQSFSRGWWESQGRTALRDGTFNSTLWYMNMKNRHAWKDKTDHNLHVTETEKRVRDADGKYKF